jgi:hypothetical protein
MPIAAIGRRFLANRCGAKNRRLKSLSHSPHSPKQKGVGTGFRVKATKAGMLKIT